MAKLYPYIGLSKKADDLFIAEFKIETDSEEIYLAFIKAATDFLLAHQQETKDDGEGTVGKHRG